MDITDYMTIEDVASYSGKSIETLRYWMKKKKNFPKRRIVLGRKVFLRTDIEQYPFVDARYGR